MEAHRALTFEEMIGEIHELRSRVVGLQIRHPRGELIVESEGELGELEGAGGDWTFQVGGGSPPEGFLAASFFTVHLDAAEINEIVDNSTGIGASPILRIRFHSGVNIDLWPAMPLRDQWTDAHFSDR